jgi:predicted glycosyl hydrolase (DUF1957 family)
MQLYLMFHLNLAYSSVEEEEWPEVIRKCYWPLLRLTRNLDIPLGIEASGYTLETAAAIDPGWIEEFRRLTRHGPAEFIGSGYAQIIGPLVPSEVNRINLALGNQIYERFLGFRPQIALVNEQAYSAGLDSSLPGSGLPGHHHGMGQPRPVSSRMEFLLALPPPEGLRATGGSDPHHLEQIHRFPEVPALRPWGD